MSTGWISAGISAVGVIGGMVAGHKAQSAADDANNRALGLQEKQYQMAQDQYDQYKSTYLPLEKNLVADAQNYDTPQAYERAAAEAQGTVSSQLGLARARLNRTVGYDPSSASAQAADANLELQGAAMGATAQNAARDSVRDKAWARKVDALGLGKGLVANATTGMANAANGNMQMGLNMANLAGRNASNTAGMITGLGNQFLKAYNQPYVPNAGGIDTGYGAGTGYMRPGTEVLTNGGWGIE